MHATGDQISIQEAQLYLHLAAHPESWATNREIAQATKLNLMTIRHHMKAFFERGLVTRVHAHPGYRYRYKADGDEASEARLRQAAEAFGLVKPVEAR